MRYLLIARALLRVAVVRAFDEAAEVLQNLVVRWGEALGRVVLLEIALLGGRAVARDSGSWFLNFSVLIVAVNVFN